MVTATKSPKRAKAATSRPRGRPKGTTNQNAAAGAVGLLLTDLPTAITSDSQVYSVLRKDLEAVPALINTSISHLEFLYAVRGQQNDFRRPLKDVLVDFLVALRSSNMVDVLQAHIKRTPVYVVQRVRRFLRQDKTLWAVHPEQMQAYENTHGRRMNPLDAAREDGDLSRRYSRTVDIVLAGVKDMNNLAPRLSRSPVRLQALTGKGHTKAVDITNMAIKEALKIL